jgi:hypothetical protein
MAGDRKRPDVEHTIALTGDELDPFSAPGAEPVTGKLEPGFRDRTVAEFDPEATTHDLPPEAAPFTPPPFPGPARLPSTEPGGRQSPILTSRVELPAADDVRRPTAFAPISTFPAATVRSPDGADPQATGAPTVETKAPGWVVGYLLLCVALTVIGLAVLYFERRLLGSASPF